MQISNYQQALVDSNLTFIKIAAGQTTGTIAFDGISLVPSAIFTPTSGWTNCNLTFQVSPSQSPQSGDVIPMYQLCDDTGAVLTIAASGASYIPIQPVYTAGLQYINVVCSTMQVSAVTLGVVLIPLWQGLHS